ncbi:MAG: glycosyltransferase family 2 protein [Duncaniella sp.]|nr:glycosyltransferase family 2 protein [Duncaniella sp.]
MNGGESAVRRNNRVAVVILNWNGARFLKEYLPSVVKHTPGEIADVIVADNGSTDESLAVLDRDFPQVKTIRFSENHGFAEGYNLAIAEVSKEYRYTVLLNSDVKVDDDWLTPLHRFMESHPGAGAVQPKLLSLTKPDEFEYAGAMGGFLDRNGYPYCRGRVFDTVEKDCGQYDTPMQVDWASGAALMVDNALYLWLGGLDKEFFAHMEEIDLCWRMRLAGREVWAVPDSHVYHLGCGSLPPSNPRKTYLNFRNNLLMLYKNLPRRKRGRKLIWRRMLDTLAWLKFMAGLDFSNGNAVLKAHRDFARMRKLYAGCDAKSDMLAGRVNILTEYFARGHRKFSEIRQNPGK